ncbi:four-helix bundle copper-binding protein [uncultured Rhodoblastus sp.]|uniref:four-helix bundle copper-binding protein n=1 Tax=uncultured Rhodoblastus sp. TaxID=543037 RepID=UPI0025E03A58|nr:four-helix bundle copper-binding protein [uncultured Rhodoblastus sp.]
MERRAFLAAAGAAALLSTTDARAQTGEMRMGTMHPPKYKALQELSGHCVGTANDCLRHCIGMLAMNDHSMTGCINTAYQVVVACGALQALAAVNSRQTPAFAKATAEICAACQRECEKYPEVAECKACAESCKACGDECRKIGA